MSPIHIGSGEVYEPTNFIIDGSLLYRFEDEDFYMALPDIKKEAFMRIVNENKSDSFVRIHNFVKENKEIAKSVAITTVKVTNGLQKDYDRVLGKIRQFEGRGGNHSRVFNQFLIQKIQRKQVKTRADNFVQSGYIIGSSLKGSISTAYQEFVYKKEGASALKTKFQSLGKEISNNIFKDFKVSDSRVLKIDTTIGFSVNKERFDYDFHNPQANVKLSTYIEIINSNSEFIVDINYNKKDLENKRLFDMKEILESCTAHYMPIFRSIFANRTDGKKEYINEYLSAGFYEKYRHFELKKNQYLLRVGKHSGARAVTIDGIRDIKSKISGGGKRRKPNKWEQRKDETTTWLFGETSNSNSNLLPFGWLLCEVVEDGVPTKYEAIESYEEQKMQRLNEIKEQDSKKKEIREAEAKTKQEAKEKREAELACMTPVQKIVDDFDNDIAKVVQAMKSGSIDDFEKIKKELAKELKKILQQIPKTWDKAKKKALDRKVYIEGLLG